MQRIFQSASAQQRLQSYLESVQSKVLAGLRCNITPRQLAFTLALGFAIGCIPLLGVTTVICAGLALLLRLNMPAIQAANWVAMPLQIVLLYPFLRLGQWLIPGHSLLLDRAEFLARVTTAPWSSLVQMGNLFGLAMLAWVVTAGPALLVMTLLLTPLMNRASRLVGSEPLLITRAE